MEDLPSIIVVSSSCTKPKSIIKLITNKTPEDHLLGVVQPWKIDTKYYTAFVKMIGITPDTVRDETFNNSVEALIIHMDSNKQTGLEDLEQWESLENDCEPEIKLLIANYCTDDTKITKTKAVEWCLKKGFEFIELYPTNIEPSEDQDIISEKFGISRVIEALEAHMWSNLTMKKSDHNLTKQKPQIVESQFSASHHEDEFVAEDEFTELFSQLNLMKESLQSLPMNQRRQCAEQMVTAFWNVIGGDEEELLNV